MLLLYFLLLGAPLSSFAADAPDPQAASIPVHFEARQLSDVVDSIARATGRSFIYGDGLTGRVTVTVPARVTPAEALELLNAVLFLKGFAAIPIEGGVSKIVKVADVAGSAPVAEGALDPGREGPVTTLISLRNVDAESVVTALASLTAKTGVVLAYPPTNSLILAGSEAQVARLVKLSRLIDRAADEGLMVRSLRYREADVIAAILTEVFEKRAGGAVETQIWSNPISNQIIARAESEQLLRIRELIDDLDHPVLGGGGIQVVRIVNRDVTEVADQLNAMSAVKVQRQSMGNTPEKPDTGENLIDRSYSVGVDEATQSLILVADPDTLEVLKRAIVALDKLPPRISVEVLVMEISKPTSFAFGVDYFLPVLVPSSISDPIVFVSTGSDVAKLLANPFAGANTGVPATKPAGSTFFGRYVRAPIQIPLVDGSGNVLGSISIPRDEVSIQASDIRSQASVLLRPHLIVLSGEEHEIFVGDNIPIPVSRSSGSEPGLLGVNPATSTAQNIERVDVGIKLRVRPTVGQMGVVHLELDVELSGLAPSLAGNVEAVGPTLIDRKIKAKVSLKEGEHAVIGAALDRKRSYIRYGIPFLRDIPGLGYLFGGFRETTLDQDLIIVVTAHVMRDMDEQTAESIRRRLAMERNLTRFSTAAEIGDQPFAVLLDTVTSESKAKLIAESFTSDGFETQINGWNAYGQRVWDIYLVDLPSFAKAGALARALNEAGWSPEITLLSKRDKGPDL